MELLENPLIQKYFGTLHGGCPPNCGLVHTDATAFRVLRAMSQPIYKGERMLKVWHRVDYKEGIHKIEEGVSETEYGTWHPDFLRLPDALQKRECDCTQGECRHGNFISGGSQIEKPDTVEKARAELFSEICASDFRKDHARDWLEDALSRLIYLAKASK